MTGLPLFSKDQEDPVAELDTVLSEICQIFGQQGSDKNRSREPRLSKELYETLITVPRVVSRTTLSLYNQKNKNILNVLNDINIDAQNAICALILSITNSHGDPDVVVWT